MKELKQFPTTDHNKFPQKYYFKSVAKNIIKIANLKNTNKIILDFGCGQKIFSKILKNKKIVNYDIKPEYTEFETYENLHFDIVIFNHVLMYFNPEEIDKLFKKMYEKNRNCEFVIGVGRQNIVSKLAKVFTFNFKAHAGTLSTYKEQLEIIEKHMKILKYKKNIFFMTDIYYTRFI